MTSQEHFDIGEKCFNECEKTLKAELLKEALENFNYAIELQPNFAEAYYKRALVNGLLDELDSKYQDLSVSMNIYKELIKCDNGNPELHFKLALVHKDDYQDEKNVEKAIYEFNTALKLGCVGSEIYFNIGEIYSQFPNVKPKEALCYYNKAIELEPCKAEYYLARGDCYDLLKENESALIDFSKGVEINPEDWRFYNRRGELYIQLKKWDKAANDYRLFRRLYPHVRELRIELLKNIKGGTFFEFYFASNLVDHEHWDSDSYYLEDSIIIEFLQSFSPIKQFNFYGENKYSPNELKGLLANLQGHLNELNHISNYADFIKHIEYTKFLHTLIREFDGIDIHWQSVFHQLKEITIKLIDLISIAITENQHLFLFGI
jgi:Flp pilus assembly protein TadD, contains TPR repeats